MTAPTTTVADDRSKWLALYVLCTGMLMIVLDVTVVNVALPSIRKDLGFTSSSLAWVVNAYLIAFGGLLLLAGRLGDLFGQRRVFLAGLGIFSAASMLCGLSQNQLMLVTSRFLQGAGGALTSAVILGMIVTMFPQPQEQAKAIGVFAFVASAGGAVGLLAGGIITDAINWHWIFFVNVPIGIATAVLALRYVNGGKGMGAASGLDIVGSILVTSALMLGVYTIVKPAAELGWGAGRTAGFGLTSVVLLAAFIAWESKTSNPLMPLRIFRSRNVCGANIIQVLGAAGLYGMFFLCALYAQRVLHYEPLELGFAFLPMTILMGWISVRYAEKLFMRFGGRNLCATGLACIAISLGLLTLAPIDAGYWLHLFPSMIILGVGAGLCFPPLMGLAMSGVEPQDAGLASGLVNTSGQVGGALGLAVLATISSGRSAHLLSAGRSEAASLTSGYHLGFVIASALILVGVIVAVTVLQTPAMPSAHAESEITGDEDVDVDVDAIEDDSEGALI